LPRRLAFVAALLFVLFARVTFLTLSRGEAELSASERAFDAGELEPALRHARRAAVAYVPGARHVEAAYARLSAVARGAERTGDLPLAIHAWQAVRSAALETRHIWSPHAPELEQADANLARLCGSAELPAVVGPPALVQPGWALLLGAGFLGALASLFWFCASAWTASGRWRPSRASWPALGWCACVLAFGWALLHA
jgi:hypothetical protein